jgi:hypothetical protein
VGSTGGGGKRRGANGNMIDKFSGARDVSEARDE